MNSLLALALAVLLLEVGALAQTRNSAPQNNTTASALTTPAPSDQELLVTERALTRVDNLWDKPLDWEEKDSPTGDIVTHVRQSLGDEAPAIEVRGQNANRSTFVLEKSPLGPTLSSLAALADVRVWVFPGRLVLASEAALTPAEHDAMQAGMGGEWKERRILWNAQERLEQTSLTLVGNEIKERLAAKGITAPPTITQASQTLLPYELPWSELSPATQDIVRDLLESRRRLLNAPSKTPPTLDDSVIVGFDDTQEGQMQLSIQKPKSGAANERDSLGNWYAQKPPLIYRGPGR